ncbi:MAG: Unknown protein [uncultured Sulfurovum sp.]|uniref:Uncharacterized protein n=1 Tax=uncultured Sulfurovum sp. TaxID=269237 RepID=A0A6S6SE81_9BACT|nr:MAG: Unknown protein [uncultured Sulfurovum sp.]
MADYIITKESKAILRDLSMQKSENLLCPILRVLQMRHSDLDIQQATRVIRTVLAD